MSVDLTEFKQIHESPLNNSKSKQVYSFSKEDRFISINEP